MSTSITELVPTESGTHEHPCSWCTDGFATVPELLDHVVDAHLDRDVEAA